VEDRDILTGQAGLMKALDLRLPAPPVRSVVGPGMRRSIVEDGGILERYPASYLSENSVLGHLRFALKNEPLYLGVFAAAFARMNPSLIEAWVRSEPTGAYARRAWFLWEWLTKRRLNLPDAGQVAYVAALDPDLHITAKAKPSRRHRVYDNIPGVPGFAPTVRRTTKLDAFRSQRIDAEVRSLIEGCDPAVLARAVNYLYTKETKSSFAIERETASGRRAERFVAALRASRLFDPSREANIIELQNLIVDPRYAERSYRTNQIFVGETLGDYREHIHFICPKPEDVPSLMDDWTAMTKRLRGMTDAVAAAALVGFGFVFVHPFNDGNGRIHRFLVHHILAAEGFTPPDVLFPVSAAIMRDQRSYEAALNTFSQSIAPFIVWNWTRERTIRVANDTAHLYRYFDATPLTEFLYEKILETVQHDLREELEFLRVYDQAMMAAKGIVDAPDRRLSLLVRLIVQNQGKLSTSKRAHFAEISDQELSAVEAAISRVIRQTRDVNDPFVEQ
jgi:Fic family protein